MCQHAELRTKIEELFLLGMPRKICSRVEVALKKRQITKGVEYNAPDAKIAKDDTSIQYSIYAHQINNSIGNGLVAKTYIPRSKAMFKKIEQQLCKLKRSAALKILMQTSQPAHVIATAILLFVMMAIWPNIFLPECGEVQRDTNERSGLALITYLGAFATHFGAQIWMTFVSGLSLYFALPRHTFGLCQQILFPKYFAMNSMLSICTLIMYVKVIDGRWELSSYVQVISLSLCAAIEVAVRLYLAPPLLRLMREKHRFETSIGSGQEVGYLDQKDLLKCPHYQSIHRSFRQIHMIVAMGNLVTLVCTFLHLHYLASKIRVS